MDGAAAPVDPPAAWVEITSSPVPLTDAPSDTLEREALARCGVGEAGLTAAARLVVWRTLRGLPLPSPGEMAFAQRSAGEPHPWARAWSAHAKALVEEATLRKLDAWLADDADREAFGRRRCAVASGVARDGSHALAVVAIDALADLAPLPTRGRTGQWLTVEARLHGHAEGGSVVVLGPSGQPRQVPVWTDGATLHARLVLNRPGRFTVQVLASLATGPRPVLEASVFADIDPPSAPNETDRVASGDHDEAGNAEDDRLAAMLGAARLAAGEPPLTRDVRLDGVAQAHARQMAEARLLAHDAGDGDPLDRLRAANLTATASAENVAHARSTTLAQDAIWQSPSHRANLLRRDFDRVGVAVVRDGRGEAWIVETFASGLR